MSCSAPVPASAPLSDGPSVRVRTVRARRTASGMVATGRTTHAVSPSATTASAILVVNNVRDLETDRRAGKRTLAVRLGRARTRAMYAVMLAVAYLALGVVCAGLQAWVFLPLATIPLAARLVGVVRSRTDGPSLNGALAGTGALQLAFCVLLSAGVLLS